MKLLLLSLYRLSERDHFLKVFKRTMDDYSDLSILFDSKKTNDIGDEESNLYGALMQNNLSDARISVQALKDAYQTYGKIPTQTSSGYFNMVRFLNEVEEFIIVARAEN
jgi:hypothetical protein